MISSQNLHTTTVLTAAIAISLAACFDNQTTPSPDSTPLAQTTEAPNVVSIPGVTNPEEINFRTTSIGAQGFFDAVNSSDASRIEVSDNLINVYGWAILAHKGRPADNVLITYGDNNTVVAVAPVNVERPDVAKNLSNSAFANSGWNINFDVSTLSQGTVMLKAWAYDSETQEATQLTNTHEIIIR